MPPLFEANAKEDTLVRGGIPLRDGQAQIPMPCSHVAMSPQEVPQSGHDITGSVLNMGGTGR